MSKKIKTFSVDGDVYSELMKIFKRKGVKVSLSSYVNNCLRGLLGTLTNFEYARKAIKSEFKVPLSFIVNCEVGNGEVDIDTVPEGEYLADVIRYYEDKYEASKTKLPIIFNKLIRSGLFELSADKKYLIEKKTGKKYRAFDDSSMDEVE